MRNSEHYRDPTAGRAMMDRPQRLESITGLKKPRIKKTQSDQGKPAKKIIYDAKPAYVAK